MKFRDEQIICVCRADSASRLYAKESTFDKSLSIKQTIYNIKLQRKYFQFHSSCMLFFLVPQYCCFQNSEFNNTLLYQNEGRGNTVTRTSAIPVFQIFSRSNKTLLLLYACEVIYFINKGLISLYVQEQGGILLKFNILRLHYVTHYCTRIEWQSFKAVMK